MAAHILVVDDNPDLGLTLKVALELEGFNAEVASTGSEAIALQRQNPADVLITDIFMPDSDGFELIARCAANTRRRRLWSCPAAGRS
jgi:two-component system catabolic regulation response regulator CreB